MDKSLKKKAETLPKGVGVYLFKDASARIIYIGKAQNLKKRVQTHFAKKNNFFSSQLIDNISDIDWIKTKNEKEAFLLEDQLIKKYQPRYNIQWRDDKSYFWVRFTDDEWPRVQVVHKPKLGHKLKVMAASIVHSHSQRLSPKTETTDQIGSQDQQLKALIGPFTNGRELRKVLRVLRKVIPYRTCKNPYEKPCLQWHIGLCPAHGASFKFQVASYMLKKYLDSLNALSQMLRLYAGEAIRIEAYDISNIQGKYATGSMIVFYGNKPQKSDYRKFRIKTVQGANDIAMIKEVLRRRLGHPEWPYPDLILIDGGKAQLSAAKLEIGNWKLEISLLALAKREDEIYTEYSQKPLKITYLPESLRLTLQHIRDEAHRFAIFYYRYLHAATDFKRPRKLRKTDRKTRQSPRNP